MEEKISTKISCSIQDADCSLPLFSTPSDLPDSPPPLPPPIIPATTPVLPNPTCNYVPPPLPPPIIIPPISTPILPPPVFNVTPTPSPLQALNPATTPVLPHPTCNSLLSYDCSPGFLVQTRATSCSSQQI